MRYKIPENVYVKRQIYEHNIVFLMHAHTHARTHTHTHTHIHTHRCMCAGYKGGEEEDRPLLKNGKDYVVISLT